MICSLLPAPPMCISYRSYHACIYIPVHLVYHGWARHFWQQLATDCKEITVRLCLPQSAPGAPPPAAAPKATADGDAPPEDETKFDEFMGNDAGALATFGEYDQDDKEADEVGGAALLRAHSSMWLCTCVAGQHSLHCMHGALLRRAGKPAQGQQPLLCSPSRTAYNSLCWQCVALATSARKRRVQ